MAEGAVPFDEAGNDGTDRSAANRPEPTCAIDFMISNWFVHAAFSVAGLREDEIETCDGER